MSNSSAFRSPSPALSQRDAKRLRLDATPSIHRSSPFPQSFGKMSGDRGNPQLDAIHCRADTPTDATDNVMRHQWPASSSALAPDPNAPGSCGHYFQGGDYSTPTKTTSVPIAVSVPQPPSSRMLGSSSVPSLGHTPFASVIPAATFFSDTSAATHHASTTSIDHTHGNQIVQQPGGTTGLGFQFWLGYSNMNSETTQSRVSIRESPDPQPQERSSQFIGREGSRVGRLRPVGDDSLSESLPFLLPRHEVHRDRTSAPANSHSLESAADVHATTGSDLLSQNSVVEPNLTSSSILSSHGPSSLHNESVGTPPQTTNSAYPTNPFASALARDALLTHAYRIYNSPASPLPSGLSPAPVCSSVTDPNSPGHAYPTQLLPLLTVLRTLHPHHLPTLLLFSCVLYAVGDFNGSLTLNSEILHTDPYYVCHRLVTTWVSWV